MTIIFSNLFIILNFQENQLNNWSGVLNIASRNLLNSKALIENIQNLIGMIKININY